MAKLLAFAVFVLIAYVALLVFGRLYESDIKDDETVFLFPTHAYLIENGSSWRAPIHGWVFESEDDSISRSALTETLIASLGLDQDAVREGIFRQRASMFLVDNERNKRLRIRIGNQTIQSEKSDANGHFYATADFPTRELSPDSEGGVDISVVTPDSDQRLFTGRIQLIQESGVSVISDIDDTVKVSHVLDKKELVKKTFTEPFKAVPGMAQAYASWARQGAIFHYVSSSPWQLYPYLKAFFEESGFPRGSFHLKQFRVKDQSFFDLLASPMDSKVPTISRIIEQYPERKFILVGDSGEKDPEVYASVFQRYIDQIRHIFIRNVTEESSDSPRYREAFEGINREYWTVFDAPTVLMETTIPSN